MDQDNTKLHNASPFRVVAPDFNAILIHSSSDLAKLATQPVDVQMAGRNRTRAEAGLAALDSLWSDKLQQYVCHDRASRTRVESASVGGLLPVFAAIPADRSAAIAQRIKALDESVRYLLPSHDTVDLQFESKRYWRGPAWLIVNYLVADGLRLAGQHDLVQRIESDSVELIKKSGFAEYYDPHSGEPCGGATFTWTAAMVMEFLNKDLRDS